VKKMIGPDHLGVGSDIDLHGYDDMPPEAYKRLKAGYKDSYAFRDKIDIEGIDHPKRMFDVTEGLIRRKYTDAEILGILGGNFRRVLTQIWKGMPA
jgi:membrane dipeptidase